MRLLILFISFLISQVADSQIINASPPYRITASTCVYILDSLTTETVQTAYSFRKLRSAYTGNCIRVRESGGNTEQDFGFTGGCGSSFLDTSAMKTFVGANSGYIVSFYDQSGNGRTATNATSAQQPRIINAGAVEYDNSHVAGRWLGDTYKLSTSAFAAYPDSMTSNFVMRVHTDVTYNASVTKTSSNVGNPLDHYNQRVWISAPPVSSVGDMSVTFNNAAGGDVWSVKGASVSGTVTIKAWKGTTSVLNTTTTTYADDSKALIIGSRADGATGFNGYFFEAITFSAISETELISGLHANQKHYYGY